MRLLVTTLLCFLLKAVFAQSDKQLIVKGNQLYKKQDFENAAKQYKQAAEKNDKNVQAQYNLGNALYKSKKTEEAQKAFEAAAAIAGDKNMKARSSYNKGVVLTRDNKLKESIDAYKQSLRSNPTDEEVRENLQKAINELKKQDQKKEEKNNKRNQDQKQEKNNDQQEQPKNKSNLNQKQAEKMLNAVRQEEKKLQQDQQKSKAKTGRSPDKDW